MALRLCYSALFVIRSFSHGGGWRRTGDGEGGGWMMTEFTAEPSGGVVGKTQ